ncbi:MAG TPA: group III truncated hemoglobin [Flavipsychrobacter sp.]|nr:group III truncated hemoglobin [Flavipsychrobacter sp.]
MNTDIQDRSDIEQLVNSFYDKVKKDNDIGPIFLNIIGNDWSHHLPIMYQFWETILLGVPGYTGNPVKKHMEIDRKIHLEDKHYAKWILLWTETVDELFTGSIAEEAKKRAKLMMDLISYKVSWAREGKTIL